ncbi:19e36668-df9a-4adf-bc00-66123b20fd83-CDS [Sclerotinia trifoliorum]|uniref:19e36668-df9a-4adf-bc00-66123b20fd83-CDS n=1 Tax=Sclerotinia trifoliorum TaxID=28548 RepID=A0A8H2ZNA3_9HELO|nr:19e36668-df9a-4adf-bc00-66123b20fd83-CDS [Sclerotinia trifoliorum]
MNHHNYQSGIGANEQLYQLPDGITIQAAPLPVHPIYYNGIQVPQYATLTQVDIYSGYIMPIHPNFGPFPLPNDHPVVPYSAEEGMHWIGYLAPDPENPILMDNEAYYMNTYDINGPLYAPSDYPQLASPTEGFPPSIAPFQPEYQQPTYFNPPSPVLTGRLSGDLPDLQNSTLNNGTGLDDPPIANPTAELVVQGYLDENIISAMENRRFLLYWNAIPHPPELTDEYCEGIRSELERMRPVWARELEAGVPLSEFSVIEDGGDVGSNVAGAANEEIEEQDGSMEWIDEA